MNWIVPLLAGMLLQSNPTSVAADPRIQTYPYSDGSVVNLTVAPGYAALIELAGDEQVDTVVLGNSDVWQVTEVGIGNRLVVKPLSGAEPTNMVVMSSMRRYVFLLEPSGGVGQTSLVVRFVYPASSAQTVRNVASYKFRGDRSLFPVAMRDDGRRTRISWAKQSPVPAIVSVGDGNAEAIVNGKMVGNEYVIEGTAARYRFRYGEAEAEAIRQNARRSSK